MRSEFWEVVGALVALVGLVLFLLYAAAQTVVGVSTDSACLAAGWREGRTTWAFDRYCVTRNDQTDTVRPLSEVQKEK